jgi:hypothetical protein
MSASKKAKEATLAERYVHRGLRYAEQAAYRNPTSSPLAGMFTLKAAEALHPMYGSYKERERARTKGSMGLLRIMQEKSVRENKIAKLGDPLSQIGFGKSIKEIMEEQKRKERYQRELENLKTKLKSKLDD